MTRRHRILYNLERNSHFHRPYYYGSEKAVIKYNPRRLTDGGCTLGEEA
jgi:hypothetical protein